jgi:chemotaxis protein CheD
MPQLPHLPRVFLEPGELCFGAAPLCIATLLGSCVAIVLWHPLRRIGGMCHYVLGSRRRAAGQTPDGRFAREAFAGLLREIAAHAARPAEFQGKIFGGGAMFAAGGTLPGLGAANIAIGRALLAEAGIPLVAEHVGGNGRRKLTFDLATGHVWLAFPDGQGAFRRSQDG